VPPVLVPSTNQDQKARVRGILIVRMSVEPQREQGAAGKRESVSSGMK
jgi:hypothetical protein